MGRNSRQYRIIAMAVLVVVAMVAAVAAGSRQPDQSSLGGPLIGVPWVEPEPGTMDDARKYRQTWQEMNRGRTGDETAIETQGASEQSFTIWQREYDARNWDVMTGRNGIGPDTVAGTEDQQTGGQRTVLVVSDSYGYGIGLSDLGTAWPEQLAAELRLLEGDGKFQVRVLARPGGSWMEYAQWLTPQRLAEIDPDIIVVGYHPNDPIPSGRERGLCPDKETCAGPAISPMIQFTECMQERGGIYGAALSVLGRFAPETAYRIRARHCGAKRSNGEVVLDSMRNAEQFPDKNRYIAAFDAATRTFAELDRSVPVLVMPLYNGMGGVTDTTELINYASRYLQRIGDAGLRVVTADELNTTMETLQRTPLEQWSISPADGHAPPLVTHAWAKDLAPVLRKTLTDRSETDQKQVPVTTGIGDGGQEKKVVGRIYPFYLAREENGTSSVSVATVDADKIGWFRSELVRRYENVPNHQGRDRSPCVALGRPHARIELAPGQGQGTLMRVRLDDADQGTVVIAPYGYDNQGREVVGIPTTMNVGEHLDLKTSPVTRGVLVGGPDAGCGNGRWLLPPWTLNITRVES